MDVIGDDAKGDYRRFEVLTGPSRRRRRSAEEKGRIVAETLQAGVRVSDVARRWQVCAQQVWGWCREAREGHLTLPAAAVASSAAAEFVPIVADAAPGGLPQGPHGLAAMAAEVLGEDPFSGAVLVFRAKRADRVKIPVWDGSGLVLVWTQMPQGVFHRPKITDGVMRLSALEFAALFDGIDWRRVQATKVIPRPVAAA